MRATLSLTPSALRGDAIPRGGLRRPIALRRRIAVLAIAALAALAALYASQALGALESDLAAAADAVGALPADAPPSSASDAVRAAFGRRAVSVDTSRFPAAVAVTLHGVEREACISAALKLRRIEGNVVVQLENYPSQADCGAVNDMTWRIMP